ncbi:ABC transporter permease [Dysgonomonas sp. 521]|uniref:ABC transporter permease n=1 Tax=Dysgonomonas sp. 521 TaxID=2302932 RepID=UPI0013D6CA6E|nr:FtsX-like permease family protein [Dysgonomonas sp. 521]NDV94936.1 ABC transporter permease [Dysgonomonas sp. 521]
MIRQIFKIIWTERKINIWILSELVLVFCILWFCVDYIYFFTKRYLEPTGYDIEHVYSINLGVQEEGNRIINNGSEDERNSQLNTLWTIIDRIKKYPDVAYLSLSYDAIPYSGSFRNNTFTLDSVVDNIQIKTVVPEYFNVFDIDILQGNIADWNNRNSIVISGDRDNLFLKRDAGQIKSLDFGEEENENVIGVAEPTKRSEFNKSEPVVYVLLSRNDAKAIDTNGYTEICVRVKAGADKDFAERFTKDMQEQIAVNPYFLSSVVPISDIGKNFAKWTGYDSNFKSIFSITAFLLINIFLAVVGTFWFRTQTRRSEIGLRVALGSPHRNIQLIFILETVILIFLASVIAAIVCINVSLIDILKDIGVPAVDRNEAPAGIGQYFINYGITFLILAAISIVAVWYPSRRASKIQPAEALRDE